MFSFLNKSRKSTKIYGLMLLLNLLTVSTTASAICPLCTIAVGSGIGLAQWLGIDDSITGLWVGGMLVSISVWTINWLDQKNIRFFGRKPLVFMVYYGFTILPLYWHGVMGHMLNKLWGIDKLELGIVIGSMGFALGAIYYEFLKKRNLGKAYFPFQKVVMPIAPLLLLSLILYFLTK